MISSLLPCLNACFDFVETAAAYPLPKITINRIKRRGRRSVFGRGWQTEDSRPEKQRLPERSFRKKDKKASSFPEPRVITRPGSLISFPFRSWPCGRLTTEPGSSFQGPTSIQPREFCAQKRRRRRTAQQCGRGRPYARRKDKITAEETNRESFRALVRAPSARDGSNKRAPVCD